jgi:CMP-N-acetylneuraminic acid synthetase
VHGLGGWRGSINAQSQDLDPTYQPTYGGMFIKTDMLLEAPYYYAFHNQGMYEVPQWQGIDIDNEFDLMEAQQWLIERQQDLQEKV